MQVFTVLSVARKVAPMTLNLSCPDPKLLAWLVRHEAADLPERPFAAINNSFGFGGTNACLLVTTPPEY